MAVLYPKYRPGFPMYNSNMASLKSFKRYFWDCDVGKLSWDRERDFITRRILQEGDLSALRWLREQWGDESLRNWLITHQGRGLSPRQIRYWALILEIDPDLTDQWVARTSASVWESRRK
jgi:hypothetical protein